MIIITSFTSLSYESINHLDCLFNPTNNQIKVRWSVNWTFIIDPKKVEIQIIEYNNTLMSCMLLHH